MFAAIDEREETYKEVKGQADGYTTEDRLGHYKLEFIRSGARVLPYSMHTAWEQQVVVGITNILRKGVVT